MRISIIDFLPDNARMRQILMLITKFELIFDVYMLTCIIIQVSTENENFECPSKPSLSSLIFFVGVVAPCFIIKLIAFNCCVSPQSVILQVIFVWILQPLLQTTWEIYAITTLFKFDKQLCHFSLSTFNLVLLLLLNIQATVFIFFVLPYMLIIFWKQSKKKA